MTVYGRSASFALFALGAPAPQGSKRHVGRGVLIESSSKVRPWRETVKAAAPVVPRPLDGPLAARGCLHPPTAQLGQEARDGALSHP